jgi:hypothetical protein
VSPAKRTRKVTSFAEDLQCLDELLPNEKLARFQHLSEHGTLTDEILAKEANPRGLLLLAFGAAVIEVPEILEGIPSNLNSQAQELVARAKSSAPSLLQDPRIKSLARRFIDKAPREGRRPLPLPFDDIDEFNATVNYLDSEGELTPTVRMHISFTNREPLPIVSLRLVDMAFLANGFLGSLGTALESALRLSRARLLDEDEIEGVRHYLDDLAQEISRVRSLVEQLPNHAAPGTSQE